MYLFLLAMLCAVLPVGDSSRCLADENDRLLVGEVCAFSGDTRVTHSFASDDNMVEIGTKIFSGDLIETGRDGMIELILGLNRRIHLGADSSLKILGFKESAASKEDSKVVTQTLIVALRKGQVRIRVRKNLVTPTPVILRAGNMQAVLDRTDILARRVIEGSAHLHSIEFVIGWGSADFNLKVVGDKEWNPELVETVKAYAEGKAPVEPSARDRVKWQPVKEEKVVEELQHLPFSIDQFKGAPGDVPVMREMEQGA